jgi:hypothetical protein
VTPATKRLWFRWSLRTLFVVVTLFGAVLGGTFYSLRWMRLRQEWDDSPPTVYLHMQRNGRRAPWPLVPFGEHGWEIISMRFCPWEAPEPTLTKEQIAEYWRAKQLFPEAIISTSPLDSRQPQQLRTFPELLTDAKPSTH